MVGQSRGAAYRSERFQIRGLESAVRLQRRDEEGHEGVLLDRYSPEGERCPAAPEMRLSTSWLLRRIRASVSLPQILDIRVDPLGSELSRDPFAPISYRPATAVELWRIGEDWEAAVD